MLPSPKFHDQEAGVPADLSVNATDWALVGVDGVKLKAVAAVDGACMPDVTGCIEAVQPDSTIIVAEITSINVCLQACI